MDRILCIDIGGTRIKAAILKNGMSLEELKEVEVKVINSLGWLNKSLPKILSKSNEHSLNYIGRDFDKYDRISVGVPLTVKEGGKVVSGHYVRKFGVPADLKNKFEKEADCKVKVVSDVKAWIKGTLNYFNISNIKVKYPCLFIICGTAIGIGYATSNIEINYFDISDEYEKFRNISKVVNENVEAGWMIHRIIGKSFFEWVRKEKSHWNYKNIQKKYTVRLAALLKDMEVMNLCEYSDINTIFFGGGNVDYISNQINEATNKSVFVLDKRTLEVKPTLLPLLSHIDLT